MSDAISQVKQVAGVGSRDQLDAAALQPGALTVYANKDGTEEAVFTGNGVNSPKDVCARLLELESERSPELAEFANATEAALFVAVQNLRNNNPGMRTADPEQPVPAGEQFFTKTGQELKTLLAPFKSNLGALRQVVAQAGTGLGGAKNVATGANVPPIVGGGLPIDPKL